MDIFHIKNFDFSTTFLRSWAAEKDSTTLVDHFEYLHWQFWTNRTHFGQVWNFSFFWKFRFFYSILQFDTVPLLSRSVMQIQLRLNQLFSLSFLNHWNFTFSVRKTIPHRLVFFLGDFSLGLKVPLIRRVFSNPRLSPKQTFRKKTLNDQIF